MCGPWSVRACDRLVDKRHMPDRRHQLPDWRGATWAIRTVPTAGLTA
ncbi:hypothetical protein HMPREF1979_03120 [Actinomyces johnsonii F0542]|uniref:Uncharacterized protein n=1 Tax=Actinomyces johnsonii F0542 TaxID=1321818 RepID=U1RPA4_9ACTO|nr:hypothetical protein HMPREF1979_03120 [Actinomyces johnsonii F0542]